ncbi:hypothetical protein J4411_02135 [Candidatus Pacearchaeota archaeon]|nr:hypothetical protein [Candidatus Pacearchaeota archaeon]
MELKKQKEIRQHKANLGIGVAGGFVAGGSLLAYQILIPYGLGYALLGAVFVALVIYKMSVKMIEKNVNR